MPAQPAIPYFLQERLLDISTFQYGLHLLEDSTKAPLGSARIMTNMMITDRGGISKRPGTMLLGVQADDQTDPCHGFYNYIKSFGAQEIPVRAYAGELEYLHPTLFAWTRLMNGYTANQEFGFKEDLVNVDNEDYLYFCNRTEMYSRWSGATAVTTDVLSGGETTVTVDSVLKNDIFDAGTSDVASSFSGAVTGSASNSGFVCNTLPADATAWVGATLTMTSGAQNGNSVAIATISGLSDAITFGTFAGGAIMLGDTFTISLTSTTCLTDSTKSWATGQWVNFWVRFTSGSQNGVIAQITASSGGHLTFAALGGSPGTCTYEIRMTKFPSSGTLMLNGNQLPYSALASDSSFTTSPALATPTNSPVTVIPATFPGAPKGNRLETHYSRMIVGNARSGLSLDKNGVVQGSQSSGSYYVSNVNDPTNFGFSLPRTAGQGDVISTPYGGGDITDIVDSEDRFYVFKSRYIEAVSYSQDANDLATRQQLKTGFGSIHKVIKGRDDLYFITYDNQFTSVGRVSLKDTFPQSENIGLVVKALLDALDFSEASGIEYKNRLFIACKNASTDSANNRVLVYNEQTESFEGLWEIGAYGFALYLTNLHYASSQTPDVYQMFSGASDAIGDTNYPITSTWKSNWMNLTPKRRFVPQSQFNLQSINALAVEGYIRGGTTLTFEIYKDFIDTATLSFTFGGTETQFLDQDNLFVFLGDRPLGTEPLASFTEPDVNGDIHFMFLLYFPDIYSNHMSLGVLNSGIDQYLEITRFGLATTQDTMFPTPRIKSL